MVPYRGIRKATGDQMVRSAYTAPHFTYVDEIDMTELYALRKLTDDEGRHHGLEVSDDNYHLHIIVKDRDGKTLDDFYIGEQGGAASLVYRPTSGTTAWAATGPDSWDFEPSTSAWIETRYVDIPKADVTASIPETAPL